VPHFSLNALNISREFLSAPETGLSAPIRKPPRGALRYFRFNPLRIHCGGFFFIILEKNNLNLSKSCADS
jgi:hypothetical protein